MSAEDEVKEPSDQPSKSRDKTAARLGVALGGTMLIVGLTGSAWLKKRPQKPATDPAPFTMHRLPSPPGGRPFTAAPPVVAPAPIPITLETVTTPTIAVQSPPVSNQRDASMDEDFHRRQVLLARYGLMPEDEDAAISAAAVVSPETVEAADTAAQKAIERERQRQNWPAGFNPALFAFKALAYATGIVLTSFGTAIYATCYYYDAWDPELLVFEIGNLMRDSLAGFKRGMVNLLDPLRPSSEKTAPLKVDSSDEVLVDFAKYWKKGTEDSLFSEAWFRKANEVAEIEQEKKRQRLAILIEQREQRRRAREG